MSVDILWPPRLSHSSWTMVWLFFVLFLYTPYCKVRVCTPKFPSRLVPKRNMFHWAADQLPFSLGFFCPCARSSRLGTFFSPCGRCSRLVTFFVPVAGILGWLLFFCPCGRYSRLVTFFVSVAGISGWLLFLSLWQVFQAGYFFVPVA